VTVRFADASLSSELEAELAEGGIGLELGALLTAARSVVSGDVTAAAAFKDGRVRLQDEGSQLVAELAGVAGAGAGKILDTCAAPGGKTLILAERNPLARIVACESSSTRLDQLSKRLAFLGDRVECRLADSSLRSEETGFDLVLADVPCSGTGTLGRNPEIRHRLKVEDLARQAERQVAILTAAIKAVRAGGRVVYSTCSLEPEENEQVVAAALSACPEARVVSLNKSLQALEDAKFLAAGALERLQGALTAEGFLRLLPGAFETDGFFVAMIERTPG
jgi:16S rRNA (cytosine967-C5)-methyltransferase